MYSKEYKSVARKKHYEKMKSMGLCVTCGQPAAKGKVRCLNCLDDIAVACMISRAQYSEERKQEEVKKASKRANILYHKRKDARICTRCGKNKAQAGKNMCKKCQTLNNAEMMARYYKNAPLKSKKQEWIEQGLCMLCGKEVQSGYKLCNEHRKKCSNSAKQRRKK